MNPRRTPTKVISTVLGTFVLLPALLAGCGASVGTPDEGSDQQVQRPTHTIRVLLDAADEPAQIADEFGAEVLVWHGFGDAGTGTPGEPESQPFALLAVEGGLDTAAASGNALEQCPETDDPAPAPRACIEVNDREFLAGAERAEVWPDHLARMDGEGRSTIWNEGRSTIWNEGRSTIWNEGGGFNWQPENTGLWQHLELEMAQDVTLANRLGEGVTVAVIDTGVDLLHPNLQAALAPRELWLDLVDGDRTPQEEGEYDSYASRAYGHGTNVAGIIRQIAPEATILPIRVLQPDGRGYTSDLVLAIEHAVQSGADIINLSLGSADRSEAVSQVIARAAEQGVFIITAAGNSGGAVAFPANESEDVMRPGHNYRLAVTSVNETDTKSAFSAHGAPVGLAAPGELIWGPAPEEMFAAWTGTSMAAPMASGALALALAEGEDRLVVERSQLLQKLQESGADLYDGINGDYVVWSELGSSRIDFWQFLNSVLE